jgi:hypothetical protein
VADDSLSSDPSIPRSPTPSSTFKWETCSEYIKSGYWWNCTFSARNEDSSTVVSSTFVIGCRFEHISTGKWGGTIRIQASFEAIDSYWLDCGSCVGGGVAVQTTSSSIGTGLFHNCVFELCHRGSSSTSFGSSSAVYGGALAFIGGATGICELCTFVNNLDGGVSIVGSCEFIECEFKNNSGNFGGIYVANTYNSNDFLSISKCTFISNSGGLKGQTIHCSAGYYINITNSTFESLTDYVICISSSPTSVIIGSSCFRGSVCHIVSDSSLSIDVIGRLCFSNSKSNAISNILFVPSDGTIDISYECSICYIEEFTGTESHLFDSTSSFGGTLSLVPRAATDIPSISPSAVPSIPRSPTPSSAFGREKGTASPAISRAISVRSTVAALPRESSAAPRPTGPGFAVAAHDVGLATELSAGAVSGIVMAALVLMTAAAIAIFLVLRRRKASSPHQFTDVEMEGIVLQSWENDNRADPFATPGILEGTTPVHSTSAMNGNAGEASGLLAVPWGDFEEGH